MENSASEGNIELSEHFADENHKKGSSVVFVYGDLSNTASPCTETGVDCEGGEQATLSVSCAFPERSFKHNTLFQSSPKEHENFEKEQFDNKDPPSSSFASCSPLSNQGKALSSIDITSNEKCDKDLIANHSKKNVQTKDQSDKGCGLSRTNPPIMIKKVTPLKSSDHGIPKSKLLSVSVTHNEIRRSVQADAYLKRYPPISVRKTRCDNVTSTNEKSKSDASFNLMNAQHSAQCIKQGQIKCDFVCSLYKSNDWIKDSTCSPKFVGKFKQKNRKKSAHVVVKNITNSDKGNKTHNEVNTCGNEARHLKCVFCEKFFGWKAITCVKLDAPLPSSIMNPLLVLQHFGITLSIPVYGPEKKNLTFINVCRICYDLMVDGDELYQKFQSLANQMRQLWPKHTIDNNSSIVIPVSGSVDENIYGCPSPVGEPPLNNVVSGGKEKKRKSGKKPQYILPKSKKDADISMNVIIPPELEAIINMNEEKCNKPTVDAENVKPKRVRTEPLTCGLCGKDFYVEDQWEYHLENDHRVQKKWHRFTTKMHTRLRAHIISELIKHKNGQKGFEWCSDDKDRQCALEEGKISYTCDACGNVFCDQNSFVAHLRNFHSIMVDDSLVFGTECGSRGKHDNQSLDKKSFSDQSEVISGIEQGLAECYPDGSVHLIGSKLKKVEDNGGVENEILHLSHLENNAGDSLLVSTYCQNIGETSLSSSSLREKTDLNEVTAQKNNLQLDTSINEIKCLICSKKFSSKKALEDHVETSHLSSSVILKGNESGGVVDYAIDVQGSIGTVKKLSEDSNLTLEETVNRTEELMGWQSDNVLDTSNLSDKLKVCKSQLDKEMLQHLVYECEICSRRIAGKKLLLMHMKRMHDISMDLQGAERLRYCKYCLFRCTSRPLLKDHQKEKHGQRREANRQQCETCGKIYSSKYIQEHMSVMHGSERKHSCNLCGMKFFDHKGWRNHFYLEHANKEWKCGKCNLVFKKYHQLRQHITYVHSTKEFKCDKCPKTYKRKGDLTVHIKRAHEKIVSFCNYCSKQYRSPYKLKAHLVNVHGLSKEETYSQRYARHKRANNKHWLLGKDSNMPSDKTLEIPEGSEVDEACLKIEKGSSELQLAEVIESTSNDLDEVTVLILS